ncbi:MAG TPA: F0F1 ATP synthase subunit B [Bacteroidia bacterium]|jgi:F-type H+-transporting ATPase subunit b|nr:F0F1 ATP synthase subunit B [Bacteroidia bacterium]
MELVKPTIGLLFWMLVSFGIIFWILKKFAWKPILGMLKEREDSISEALNSAEKAKKEMEALQSNNEKLLAEARNQRDIMLKEAREIREQMISEAKGAAQKEADKLLKGARESIQSEKNAAIAEMKSQVATLSIQIAEKILKEELSSSEKQKTLVKSLLNEVNLN